MSCLTLASFNNNSKLTFCLPFPFLLLLALIFLSLLTVPKKQHFSNLGF